MGIKEAFRGAYSENKVFLAQQNEDQEHELQRNRALLLARNIVDLSAQLVPQLQNGEHVPFPKNRGRRRQFRRDMVLPEDFFDVATVDLFVEKHECNDFATWTLNSTARETTTRITQFKAFKIEAAHEIGLRHVIADVDPPTLLFVVEDGGYSHVEFQSETFDTIKAIASAYQPTLGARMKAIGEEV